MSQSIGVQASPVSTSPPPTWLDTALSPAVLVVLIVPLASALAWYIRGLMEDSATLQKEELKTEVLATIHLALKESYGQMEVKIGLELQVLADKVKALESALLDMNSQLSESFVLNKVQAEKIQSLEKSQHLSYKLLDAELGNILSAYLDTPVTVSILCDKRGERTGEEEEEEEEEEKKYKYGKKIGRDR